MKRGETIAKALVAAARPTAALGVVFGLVMLPAIFRGMWLRWEGIKILLFLAYAVFIFIPVEHMSRRSFRFSISIGVLLAFGSLPMASEFFAGLLGELLGNQPVFFMIELVLALCVYSYIPVRIWQKKMTTDGSVAGLESPDKK